LFLDGAILLDAVVVEREGARRVVDPRADLRIADVAEVVHLRAGLEARVLDLAEVPELNAALEIGSRTQMRIRPHRHLIFKRCPLEGRVLDAAALADRGVAQHGVRPDARTAADLPLPLEL